jgi:hypothetical protein
MDSLIAAGTSFVNKAQAIKGLISAVKAVINDLHPMYEEDCHCCGAIMGRENHFDGCSYIKLIKALNKVENEVING